MRPRNSKAIPKTFILACTGALIVTTCLTFCLATTRADEPAADAKPPGGLELTIHPAAEPLPALQYHLLPPAKVMRPGSAVPIYLRLVHEENDAWKTKLGKASDYLEMPLDKMPLDEVRKFLDSFDNVSDQLLAAARRTDCDWQYVTEDRDPLEILLPDAQFLRAYGRLLALKARYEARTGDLEGALASLQAGFALARNAAKAPFLVNQLVGIAIGGLVAEQLDVFVQQAKAPNLYWALAELPRPFISLESGWDVESRLLEMRFPELADLNRPRRPQDWQRLAHELRQWAMQVMSSEGTKLSDEGREQLRDGTKPEKLAEARVYLIDKLHLAAETVKGMPDAEVEVRYTVELHKEQFDAFHKWSFLPYSDSLPRIAKMSNDVLADSQRRELFPLVSVLWPGNPGAFRAQPRMDRRVARQQTIEALRMHAAATGKLPLALAEITVVPVPADPATGAPFVYTRQGDAAVLDIVEQVAVEKEGLRLPIRIRLDK